MALKEHVQIGSDPIYIQNTKSWNSHLMFLRIVSRLGNDKMWSLRVTSRTFTFHYIQEWPFSTNKCLIRTRNIYWRYWYRNIHEYWFPFGS